ncbi:MAG: HK97 family phage prohead protease [Dehalococcoidia bacterium]
MILSPTLNDDVRDSQEPGLTGQYPIVTRWLDVSPVAEQDSVRRELVEASGSDESGERPAENSENTITFRASVESEDRAGDLIRAEGWELDNYRLNPVVLWAHRHDLLPVGKSVDVWVENGALMAKIEFAPTEFAQQIRRLFQEGFLRGVSVGFRALRSSPRSGPGSGSGVRGTVFERQELLEISAAPVPMHPEALQAPKGVLRSENEKVEIIPLFKELADIWQSISALQID